MSAHPFAAILRAMTWVDAEDDGTKWGYPLLKHHDFIESDEGTTQGTRQMVAPDGRTFEVRFRSGDGVKIEMSVEAFASLGEFPKYCRSLGLGRLRKDLSLPLMPPADRVWIQSVQDNATLVTCPLGCGPAFFLLGPLGVGALRMARTGMVPTLLFVGTDVLRSPTMRQEARAGMAGKAWGGLIACTDTGSDQSASLGMAWEYHRAKDPNLLLEGVEAAKAALERSGQRRADDRRPTSCAHDRGKVGRMSPSG